MPLFIVLYCWQGLIFFSIITSLKNCWLLLATRLFNDNKLLTGKVSMSLCLLVSCLHFLFVGAFGNVTQRGVGMLYSAYSFTKQTSNLN